MSRRLAGLLFLCAGAIGAARSVEGAAPRWLELTVRQPITVATQEYLASGLEEAKHGGFDGVLIELDTPGGSLDATRAIVEGFLASDVPIIVYVSPAGARAGSAGVFITMAANLAAMDPASNIGAAHPVSSNGKDVEAEAGKEMARKVENDTAAFARSIAKTRGRNVDWAEKAVRDSVSVTAGEALKLHVVDLTAKSVPDLLADADGRTVQTAAGARVLHTKGATLEPFSMSIRQQLLSLLADPNLAAILMLLGMAGIGLEFYHPGAIYPGAIGALLLLLGLLATEVIPVNLGAIILLLVGAGLLITEAFISFHGAAGLLGAVCLLLGALLFVNKSSPDYQFAPGAWQISPVVVWPTPIALALIMFFVAVKVAQTRRRPSVVGVPGLIGQHAEALTEITPTSGEIFLHGEYWQARSEEPVPKGASLRVISVDGLVARVAVEKKATAG
ncbi:MAG TPA: nodulation protein NfeD [Myxococcales bacterium]|nr:nodulation protein NfeD [Myxococcales bacterium]